MCTLDDMTGNDRLSKMTPKTKWGGKLVLHYNVIHAFNAHDVACILQP